MPPCAVARPLLLPRRLLLPLLLHASLLHAGPASAAVMAAAPDAGVVSFGFEVHGRVQGVYFRATTVEAARRLGVVGWCRNTRRGTVEGVAQGAPSAAAEFKRWLAAGPPAARVDRVDYKDEAVLVEATFDQFDRVATV